MKKFRIVLLLASCVLLLCGCGSAFEKEYVSVTDYISPVQAESSEGERVTVRNMTELKKTLIDMVYDLSLIHI